MGRGKNLHKYIIHKQAVFNPKVLGLWLISLVRLGNLIEKVFSKNLGSKGGESINRMKGVFSPGNICQPQGVSKALQFGKQ